MVRGEAEKAGKDARFAGHIAACVLKYGEGTVGYVIKSVEQASADCKFLVRLIDSFRLG